MGARAPHPPPSQGNIKGQHQRDGREVGQAGRVVFIFFFLFFPFLNSTFFESHIAWVLVSVRAPGLSLPSEHLRACMESGRYPAWDFPASEGSTAVWESTEGHSPCAARRLAEPHRITWNLGQEFAEPRVSCPLQHAACDSLLQDKATVK